MPANIQATASELRYYMDFTEMTYLITMYNVVFTVKGFPAK